MTAERSRELAANLADVENRIGAACAAAGRDRSEVTMIAVTKTFPASDVRLLAELGIGDFGESRDQEAARKVAELSDLAPAPRWHFIGALQRNKTDSVARYASYLHSVDRPELVAALQASAGKSRRELHCLIQVDLDDVTRPGRSGARAADVAGLTAAVAAASGLVLAGVMAGAPRGADAGVAFARLAAVAAMVRDRYPAATMISAGMSGDLEAAITNGATHLRVGAALLGNRGHPVG